MSSSFEPSLGPILLPKVASTVLLLLCTEMGQGLILCWEGLQEPLNSPNLCVKVAFMQLEKVSLSIHFFFF